MKTFMPLLATLTLTVCAQSPIQPPAKKAPPVKIAAPKAFASAEAMHTVFVNRFLVTPGFGLSRVMVPHFYRPTPNLEVDGKPFLVHAPELIGLEEPSKPVAYSPNVDLISKADVTNRTARALMRKRALTAFETNAVKTLQAGRDLVIDQPAARRPGEPVLILGALRATRDCMQCHECAENTLLGAFSYTLVPAPVARPVAPEATNQAAPAFLSRR